MTGWTVCRQLIAGISRVETGWTACPTRFVFECDCHFDPKISGALRAPEEKRTKEIYLREGTGAHNRNPQTLFLSSGLSKMRYDDRQFQE